MGFDADHPEQLAILLLWVHFPAEPDKPPRSFDDADASIEDRPRDFDDLATSVGEGRGGLTP